ncbi:GPN-loop GTPase 2 isoform X1 [Struthio camelus]|uniref:GPN-loop GTPase 2 isoform X1 n=1 Tax=Struthio camelus TaxID=8801 RepID=UPI00051E25AB|nr:PREDICTED: GPN-loop GTPase 2 isoform X2 [Struthio camelus australis]
MSENSQRASLAFGQVVIGPPGSGKTTYCHGMQEFMARIGRRVVVVNLDPANEVTPYQCAVDVSELITLPDVMENLKLGPNGGLIYCMEYLEANFDWLQEKLAAFRGHYYLFDCPGQVELYTHHNALKNVFAQLAKWNFRLAAVHLVDSHYCTDPGKFISVLCTSLSTMLHVELPHVNVLSKMDLIEQYGKLAGACCCGRIPIAETHLLKSLEGLCAVNGAFGKQCLPRSGEGSGPPNPFNLDYYTEVLDLSYLVDHLASDPFFRNYRRLNEKLVEVIEDYSLVSFVPLNVQDKESMRRVMQAVDKANGYSFGDQEHRSLEALMSAAVGADFHFTSTLAVQEKYVRSQDKAVEEEVMDM